MKPNVQGLHEIGTKNDNSRVAMEFDEYAFFRFDAGDTCKLFKRLSDQSLSNGMSIIMDIAFVSTGRYKIVMHRVRGVDAFSYG